MDIRSVGDHLLKLKNINIIKLNFPSYFFHNFHIHFVIILFTSYFLFFFHQELENSGMYSEWASLTNLIQTGNEESQSVLGRFPMAVGKEVAMAVVKQLALNLGINLSQPAEPSSMQTDREVQWCMEVSIYSTKLCFWIQIIYIYIYLSYF